jgi:hypothetical protein
MTHFKEHAGQRLQDVGLVHHGNLLACVPERIIEYESRAVILVLNLRCVLTATGNDRASTKAKEQRKLVCGTDNHGDILIRLTENIGKSGRVFSRVAK